MYRKMLFLTLVVLLASQAAIGGTVYPWSTVITNISFNWGTHRSDATGSDNWPITWHDDGHQYAAYGDGWGFSESGDKHSNGFARIEGGKVGYIGYDIAEPFDGKCHGIISIDGVLYAWRDGDASGESAYDFTELWKSTNDGSSWSSTGVHWQQSDFNPPSDRGFFCTGFCQFGQSYAGARDNYVYIIATNIKRTDWEVQYPGEIIMMRVHKSNIENEGSYEFFDGMSGSNPTWTPDRMTREPIWQDSTNGVHRITISYNAPLGRYFLWTEHTARNSGNTAIYEAPEPWGPWKTVLFDYDFAAPITSGKGCIFLNFSNKWLSGDGKDFVAVMSVDDNWDTVEGSFTVAGGALAANITAPADDSNEWYGEQVTFTGSASGGTPPYSYSWSSDVDGYLGSGQQIIVSDLGVHKVGGSVEPHTITLTVEDDNTDTNTAQIDFTVFFKGDFEPDGDVDFVDYAVFADDWYVQSEGNDTTPQPTSAWWKLDEGSGNKAYDSSVNNNTGTLINMSDGHWIDGMIDGALDFHGTDDYVSVDGFDSSLSFGSGPFSISLWLQAHISSQNMLIIKGTSGGGYSGKRYSVRAHGHDIIFAIDDNLNKTEFWTGNGSDTGGFLDDGEWHHIVALRDTAADKLRIYADNSQAAEHTDNTSNIDSGSEDLHIARDGEDQDTSYLDGLLDDIRLYDYKLSTTEIDELFNATGGGGPVDSPANFNDDEIVDFKDLKIFVKDWLEIGY